MRNFLKSCILLFGACTFTLYANAGIRVISKIKSKNTPNGTKVIKTFTNDKKSRYYVNSSSNNFDEEYVKNNFQLDSTAKSNTSKAAQTFDTLKKTKNFVETIVPDELTDLPVGLKKSLGVNTNVTIAISKAQIYPNYTQLTVYCMLELPETDQATGNPRVLYFGADNIKLSHDGGIIGDAKLALFSDMPIPFDGGNSLLIIKGAQSAIPGNMLSQTYATLTCDGIKEVAMAADVMFSRQYLVPLDNNLEPITDENVKVKGSFNCILSDWNDILAEFTLPAFAIKGLETVAITVDKAVFDFSDLRNAPDVIFPANYPGLVQGNASLWRGVYVNKLKVTLPKEFKRSGDGSRISFEADKLIIDNLGLTGNFIANNVLDQGDASGWPISVNQFWLNIEANQFNGVGFNGYLSLPLSASQSLSGSSNSALRYDAVINPGGNYAVKVTVNKQLNFDLWQANVQINPDSYIELNVVNGVFRPKAVLNGNLTISPVKQSSAEANNSSAKSFASFNGIVFQRLVLQTEEPYIQVDYFGYKGNSQFGNFPVVINEIGLKIAGNQTNLSVGVAVNLQSGKLSASTKVTINGSLDNTGGSFGYHFKSLSIDKLSVTGNFDGFYINGIVYFNRNDPVMGTGFSGSIDMELTFGQKIDVKAQAAFGSKPNADTTNTNTFRYWYVDALATGLSLNAGTFTITGLGGGAYYHMTKQPNMQVDAAVCPTQIGYIPDSKVGLGLRATVQFNVGTGQVCKGKAALEMAFSTSGGLASISFCGNAQFMPNDGILGLYNDAVNAVKSMRDNLTQYISNISGINANTYNNDMLGGRFMDVAQNYFPVDPDISKDSQLSAFVGINYDFTNKILHANIDLYVNVAAGLIKGTGLNNRAGYAVMHFAPDEWYIYLGTPTDRLGLSMGIGSISAQVGGYFMVGSTIPGSPPPPQQVAQILGVSQQSLDYMRDLNALNNGSGFAFGANFSVSTGDLRFLMFYANFNAGAGFDIMLKNYGNAKCKQSGQTIGLNGWYANGQAYAYLQGELGIQVKLLFIHKKIPIISAGAALLLQAQLPNPSWFAGYLAGHFSVLGGLIQGGFSFKVTLGEKCEIIDDGVPLDGVKVIADFSPANNSNKVDVFTTPQAVFNMPVNKPFTMPDEQGNTATYRISLQSFTLTNGGSTIVGALKWNNNQDGVSFRSNEILPPNTQIKGHISVSFEQQSGGVWTPMSEKGQLAVETKDIVFTTGDAPTSIPLNNIAYCYPVIDQQYFFTSEYPTAYIQLIRGQAYLFNKSKYQFVANFANGNTGQNVAFSYDSVAQRVNINLPALQKTTSYTLTLNAISTGTNTQADSVSHQSQSIVNGDNNIQVANNQSNGVLTQSKALNYLTYNFSTSAYNTFKDKINAKTITQPIYEILAAGAGDLQANVTGNEGFDKAELQGADYSAGIPLVQPIAILNDDWFNNNINPSIYSGYATLGITLKRDTSILGLPPIKAVDVLTWYEDKANNMPNATDLITHMPYRYNLPIAYLGDFLDLQYQVVNKYVNSKPPFPNYIERFITGTFPLMPHGNYRVRYRYFLPGNIQTSWVDFDYQNPIY